MSDYQNFLDSKKTIDAPTGHEPKEVNPMLYDFQSDIVKWAVRRGRAAIFADCGLGKTPMQLEWAGQVANQTQGNVLIVAPLAVSKQTKREGEKFGTDVTICESQSDVVHGVNITNYEKLHKFDAQTFAGVILDESSILKNYSGKLKTQIIESFKSTPYRLACTATPAPNDYMELGNHAEFLGVMTRPEMLAMFFCHDGGNTSQWRLKGHAEDDFWRWLCSWAVMIRKPSDLGYDDGRFDLPDLQIHQHTIETGIPSEGMLFAVEAQSLMDRRRARRETIEARVADAAALVNGTDEPFLVWCDLNDESAMMKAAIPGAVEVKGSDSAEHKENSMLGFSDGSIRVLVTKPSIAGFGMNWQHCPNMVFVGLSDSYEQYYQAVRRCWRFGQAHTVSAHIVTADKEGAVVQNIKRKERDAERMAANMVEHMQDISSKEIRGSSAQKAEYTQATKTGDGWEMHLGDCVERVGQLEDDSIHYSVFSPPFASLYTYSNSDRDMGNCLGWEDFSDHFRFLVRELHRVLKPGRNVSFHCMNLPISKEREGYIGIRDFRGIMIRIFQEEGFIFHSEVCIWKDPVTAMQRTKALGLLWKQIKKDSCMSRQGIPDYLVTMRKPGDNPEPVGHKPEEFPVDLWQKYASPVWMDINPSKTLQRESAREEKDERHICPLQLEVIERAVMLWSNPGDLVLSPFAGIGSEGYVSLQMERRFVGVELKRSYYDQAVLNLEKASRPAQQMLI